MTDWAEQRREATELHAERLAERRLARERQARALVAEFVATASGRLPTEPLRVQGYGGRGSARSDVVGWYLRADRTCGIGTDGGFYLLTAPLGVVDRLRGVRLRPSPPPLVLGEGGRDGESIELAVALERLLPGWRKPAG